MMNLKTLLSLRIGMGEIHAICALAQSDPEKKEELFGLLFEPNDRVASQAAWAMTHLPASENDWLGSKQHLLINEVLICKHSGKRRLILNLLLRQPLNNCTRMDLLDFSLERITTNHEPPGIRSLCIKIAYELCHATPELMQELQVTLEMMQGDLPPAIRCARKNVLKRL